MQTNRSGGFLFLFFGFEITASTLMAKNLFTVSGPPAKRDAG